MAVVSWRIDEEDLKFFSSLCDRNGFTKQEGFHKLVEAYRELHSKSEEQTPPGTGKPETYLWANGDKKDLVAHLCRTFEPFGGALSKTGRCYLGNDRFLIYILYRTLSAQESRIVKVNGSCIRQMETLAAETGKIPLIAVFAKPADAMPFYGLLPLHSIDTVIVEAGRRYAEYRIFRRKNDASLKDKITEEDSVFVHIRDEEDKKAIWNACGIDEDRAPWAEAFYSNP